MPKQTFFNLPAEKQQTLIESAKREFSRVPFNDASIANIVKHAEIPRGSFYQYFEDKEDAFFYLFQEEIEDIKNLFVTILQHNNGNLFDSFIDIFRKMLIKFQDHENLDFFKNAFLNMNYKMEKMISNGFNKDVLDRRLVDIESELDWTILNITHKREIKHIMQILGTITTYNLMQNFAKQISFDDAINNYTFEINLLKSGLCKKSAEEK